MSDVTRTIEFYKSMSLDKRAEGFAYLIENVFDAGTSGFYPSVNFQKELPTSGDFPIDSKVVAIDGNLFFVYDENADVTKVYYGDDVINFAYDIPGEIVSVDSGVALAYSGDIYQCGNVSYQSYGNTGDVDRNGKVYFDGLRYFFVTDRTIRAKLADDNQNPIVVFSDIGTGDLEEISEYEDRLILSLTSGLNITVLFWDKSDTTLLDKRIFVTNARYLGIGNVKGRLLLVQGVGNRQNKKEREGQIQVTVFNGSYFEYLNAIKAGDQQVSHRATAVGNNIMMISIGGNFTNEPENRSNPTIYQDWVLKIGSNGEIQAVYKPSLGEQAIEAIGIRYDYVVLGTRLNGRAVYRHNIDNRIGYEIYADFDRSVHVTNFKGNLRNGHKLDFLGIAFEQIFNLEELEIYVRTSEKETFKLLASIDENYIVEQVNPNRKVSEKRTELDEDDKGLTEQVVVFNKMADGSGLPKFNEIQYMFVSSNGFSVVQAWHGYSYTSRVSR